MDLDQDGHLDIVSGCYADMKANAGLLWILRGGEKGFAKAESIKGSDGDPLVIPGDRQDDWTRIICTHAFAHDWEGDGDLDLLTGNFEGTFYLFRNAGADGKTAFAPEPEQLKSGDAPLKLPGSHSAPCLADWDGDGDVDLISGSASGGIFWAENTGEKEPAFGSFTKLLAGSADHSPPVDDIPAEAPEPKAPGADTRVWVADVNGDDKLDLLVGDSVTLVSRAEGVAQEDFEKRREAWNGKMEEFQTKMSKAQQEGQDALNELMTAYQQHWQSRSEFIDEDRTGFVWLYLQK